MHDEGRIVVQVFEIFQVAGINWDDGSDLEIEAQRLESLPHYCINTFQDVRQGVFCFVVVSVEM